MEVEMVDSLVVPHHILWWSADPTGSSTGHLLLQSLAFFLRQRWTFWVDVVVVLLGGPSASFVAFRMDLCHLGRLRRPGRRRSHWLDAFLLVLPFRIDHPVDDSRMRLRVVADGTAARLDRLGHLLLLQCMGDLLQLFRTERLDRVVRVALLYQLQTIAL